MTSTAGNSCHTFETGAECIARYDFPGNSPKDLPFQKGDIIEIRHATADPNWYDARRMSDGRTGIIPINYVQRRRALHIHEMPWFFGKIKREKAEQLLSGGEVGLFLVRESTNFHGDYTLCVVSPANYKVEHYRVISRNNKFTVDQEEFFPSLVELVKHYERGSDGLCTRLVKPLNKEDNMTISSEVFQESFHKDGWLVSIDDIKFEERIGTGEFGEVFKGKYQDKQTVAIKRLKDDTHAAQSFLREASVMTTLQHRNLVELIGITFQDKEILILTEHCAKGSLVNYLRSRGRSVIKQEEQLSFARDVCAGMQHLESKNIIHRDLAARNILLSEDLTAKVSDFGLAKDRTQQTDSEKFPVKWTAPEAIKEKKFSTKSDVWSFGILLWEIFAFGRNPYPRVSLDNVLTKVQDGYRMEMPERCPPKIYNIMKACWQIIPEQRPTFMQIINKLKDMDRQTNL